MQKRGKREQESIETKQYLETLNHLVPHLEFKAHGDEM